MVCFILRYCYQFSSGFPIILHNMLYGVVTVFLFFVSCCNPVCVYVHYYKRATFGFDAMWIICLLLWCNMNRLLLALVQCESFAFGFDAIWIVCFWLKRTVNRLLLIFYLQLGLYCKCATIDTSQTSLPHMCELVCPDNVLYRCGGTNVGYWSVYSGQVNTSK